MRTSVQCYAGMALPRPGREEEIQMSPRSHDRRHRVDVLVIEALLQQAQGDEDLATAKLIEAVALAQPCAYGEPFIRFRSSLAGLLEPLAETGSHGEFVRRILAACHEAESAAPGGTPGQQPGSNSLTYREQETLELLGQRFRNDEIARELGVSVETVKTHLSALYKKLNVHNRRDAVSAGEALGLLAASRMIPNPQRPPQATSRGKGELH